MAEENPTGRGNAIALKLPADQVRFLRTLFTDARAGVRQELKEYPDTLQEPGRLPREDAAYGRLLAALDELVIVPDADVRDVLGDLAGIIDRSNEYTRVVAEHEALRGLLEQIKGGEPDDRHRRPLRRQPRPPAKGSRYLTGGARTQGVPAPHRDKPA